MKTVNKKYRTIVSFIITIALCLDVMDIRVFAKDYESVKEIEGKYHPYNDINFGIETLIDDDSIEEDEDYMGLDENEDYSSVTNIYDADTYSIISNITSQWDGGYNASIVIKNTGTIDIRNWYLQFTIDIAEISIWNAQLINYEDGVCLIKNDGWNSNIPVGGSVEFGYSANCDFISYPDNYQIIASYGQLNDNLYDVEYIIEERWDCGYKGAINIYNTSENVIEDWILEFDYNNEFDTIWNGNIIEHKGNHYIIRNADYNSFIEVGNSISIGFIVSEGITDNKISNIVVSSFTLTPEYEEKESEIIDEIVETDPLRDLTENYVKESHPEDIIFDEISGKFYVKNQIVVSTYLGVSKEMMEQIVKDIDADIVGYIEIMSEFQLEFRSDKTYSELMDMIDYFMSFSFVDYSGLNTATPIQAQFFSDDSLYDGNESLWESKWSDLDGNGEAEDNEWTNDKTGYNDGWSKYAVGGNNWGIEALDVHLAWDYRDRFQGPVKIGIYDNMFGYHDDISYAGLISNPTVINKAHGTHVAGIIGAGFNNGMGISGVATDVKIYGYSVEDNYQQKIEDQISTLSIFSKLIENEVRIINVSYGYKDEMVLAATNNIRNARTVISDEAEALTIGLAKLIKQGYDFLIVVAAGNGYAKDYVENFSDTNNAPYGYEVYNSKERRHNGLTHITGYNDPMYSFHLTYIGSDSDEEGEDDLVKQRIMVVGAVKHISLHNYMEARFSNEGNRVDVYAPGVQILSTIPQNIIGDEYRTMNGTSMATPHISGLAALMLQANPTLRSEQIKNIIIECAGESVNTYDYSVNPNSPTLKGTVYMPNAESCVIRALDIAGGHSYYDEFFPSGTIKGKVVSDSGKSLDAIQVTLVRTSIGDANLKDYYFTTLTDEQGEFSVEVPQGKYDMIINGSTISEGTILPYKTSDIEVEPDRIVYLQTIVVSFLNTSQEIMGKCDVVGCVYDAITGATIDGAIIKARTGWNNYNGAYVNQRLWGGNNTLSDSYGNFALELYRGQYTIEVVKEGYIMGYFNVSAVKQNDRTRQTIVLTPVLDDDEYRIILVWGSEPRDLDAHLTFYKNGTKKMHMYFSNKVGYVDDKEIAILDIDDTRSYGPETITIKKKPENDEVFYFSVHNYSDRIDRVSTSLSDISQAAIRIYQGNKPVKTFYVPTGKKGTVWKAFSIDSNGIQAIDDIYYSSAGDIK